MNFPPRDISLTDASTVTLREAAPADAQALLDFLHEEVATTPYVLTVPEEVTYTIEQEIQWIEERHADPRSLWLLALVDGDIVGVSTLFATNRIKTKHTADLGTTVASAWRRRGLGAAMLEALLDWARANPDLLRITLDVMADNTLAHRMYERAGFRAIGVERRAYRQPDGTLIDGVPMELWVG